MNTPEQMAKEQIAKLVADIEERNRQIRIQAGVPDYDWHKRLYDIVDRLQDACYNALDCCEFYDADTEPIDKADYASALTSLKEQYALLIQHMDSYEQARTK